MIEIGRALLAMRNGCAALKGLGPNHTNIAFKLSTDGDADTAEWPKTVLEVRIRPSDTAAVVPFEVTESLVVLDVPDDAQLELADRVRKALNNLAYFGDRCTINRHTFAGIESEPGPGNRQTVRIHWVGAASWRPA